MTPIVAEDIEQFRQLWRLHGCKSNFEVFRRDCVGVDWAKMIQWLKTLPIVDAHPSAYLDSEELPVSCTIRVKPYTMQQLKEGKEAPRRQITIGQTRVDLRNRANYDLVVAKVPDLETVVGSYITQLQSGPTKRQKRAILCQLLRVLLVRGCDLSPWLRGQVCLWTKAPLPDDYFRAPLPLGLQAKVPIINAEGKLVGFGPAATTLEPSNGGVCI